MTLDARRMIAPAFGDGNGGNNVERPTTILVAPARRLRSRSEALSGGQDARL